MPIKGMTDIATVATRSGMPVIGRLRKGSEKQKVKKNGKNGPYEVEIQGKDLDHFRFTSDESAYVARFAKLFPKAGKGKENAIRFNLSSDNREKAFPASMDYYHGGSQYIGCDHEKIHSERVFS